MTAEVLFLLTLCSALGCGLVGGVFFGFSSFVMKALARLPPAQGIAAMQSINIVVLNPVFMTALFGTAAGCFTLLISARGAYLLAGCLLYLAGTIGVTVVVHVPRNNALASVNATSADGAVLWARYVREWTAWNHVRAAAALAAAASLTLSMIRDSGS